MLPHEAVVVAVAAVNVTDWPTLPLVGGLTKATFAGTPGVAATKVKLKALLVPPGVTTVTFATVFGASVGAVTVQLVPVEQLTLVPGVVPKLMAVAPLRLVPVRVTLVPAGPLAGLIVARVGAATAPIVRVCDVGVGITRDAGTGALKLSVIVRVGAGVAGVCSTLIPETIVPAGTLWPAKQV